MYLVIRIPLEPQKQPPHLCPSGFQYQITLSVNHINQQLLLLLQSGCHQSVVVIIEQQISKENGRRKGKRRKRKRKSQPAQPVREMSRKKMSRKSKLRTTDNRSVCYVRCICLQVLAFGICVILSRMLS